ncbi:MAG: dihydroneopterin aldolase [Gammaproteobacteria bacterium]|nr:dihydroneopterin aldolase [Gammaproteobacteria bacterium]
MDRVLIEELKLEATIGVFEWEKRIRQRLLLDLELATDAARAAASDDIADARDYKAITQRVRALVEGGKFQLVETVAEAVARLIIEEFGVRWLRVTVRKPGAVTGAKNVGVVIERGTDA